MDGCQFHSHPDCGYCSSRHHGVYAEWRNGHCPACDEAERIAAEYDDNREDAP